MLPAFQLSANNNVWASVTLPAHLLACKLGELHGWGCMARAYRRMAQDPGRTMREGFLWPYAPAALLTSAGLSYRKRDFLVSANHVHPQGSACQNFEKMSALRTRLLNTASYIGRPDQIIVDTTPQICTTFCVICHGFIVPVKPYTTNLPKTRTHMSSSPNS